MNGKIGITLTGADERTYLDGLVELSNLGAEIGVLFTYSPDGRNRYPSLEWIKRSAEALGERMALHICGNRARYAVFSREMDWILIRVGRVQVNGSILASDLKTLCSRYPDKTFITQDNFTNSHLARLDVSNHSLLVDGSGGRGKLPSRWVRPKTGKSVGFAGGLGPETLETEMPKIMAVAKDPWWVDMESRLRDEEDWFDVGKAEKAISLFKEITKVQEKPC